jgi:hypothetical protein
MSKTDTNFSLTKVGSHIKLQFAETYNTELWPSNDIHISERFGNIFAIGLPSNMITLDYTKSTSPTSGSLSDYILELQGLINPEGLVDSNNSRNTLLLSSVEFTGEWTDTSNYSEFTCLVSTDQEGTLYMDISTDGVNIDRTKTVPIKIPGGVHTLVVVSKYMRIRIINGSVDQGYLRVQTILHKTKSKELSSTTSQVISDRNDVNLQRIVNDHTLDLARGVVSDKKIIHVFGRNDTISTSDEDIWITGGDYNFLSTASVLEILSENSQDDSSGLGARTVNIIGLDQNYNEIEEVVDLIGNSASLSTTNQFIRVNQCMVLSCGTLRGGNYNDLTIRVPTVNTVVAKIDGGYGTIDTANYGIGTTQLGLYSVPAGKSAYITRIEVNIESNKTGDISLYTLNDSSIATSPRHLIWKISNFVGNSSTSFKSYFKVEEKSDIWFRGVASATSNMEVNLDLFIIDN